MERKKLKTHGSRRILTEEACLIKTQEARLIETWSDCYFSSFQVVNVWTALENNCYWNIKMNSLSLAFVLRATVWTLGSNLPLFPGYSYFNNGIHPRVLNVFQLPGCVILWWLLKITFEEWMKHFSFGERSSRLICIEIECTV